MTTSEELPSTSEIAGAALELLKSHGGADGLYLSRLGGLLSTHFRCPTREILGKRKLSQILTDGLGDAVRIEGAGANLSIKLVEPSEINGSILRFDPVIWAAFSKPHPEGGIKYVKTTRPFTFVNDITKVTWDDPKEIRDVDLADKSLPKMEREREIAHRIDDWCSRHGFHPSDFKYEASNIGTRIAKQQPQQNGLLRQLVEAIPPERRRNFSLSFDLIHELLDK